jgi:hypothetical protein
MKKPHSNQGTKSTTDKPSKTLADWYLRIIAAMNYTKPTRSRELDERLGMDLEDFAEGLSVAIAKFFERGADLDRVQLEPLTIHGGITYVPLSYAESKHWRKAAIRIHR